MIDLRWICTATDDDEMKVAVRGMGAVGLEGAVPTNIGNVG